METFVGLQSAESVKLQEARTRRSLSLCVKYVGLPQCPRCRTSSLLQNNSSAESII